MTKKLSLTPKTVAIVENVAIVRAWKAKTTDGKCNAEGCEVSRTKISILPPTTATDTHIITVKRDI